MFKKITLISLSLLLTFTLVGNVGAQFDWLPRAGITPDSPLYFLDKMGEKIGMFFAFRAESKVKKALKYAEERLAEAREIAEKGKTEEVKGTTQNYEEYLSLAQDKIEEIKQKGRSVEDISSQVAGATSKHLAVLEGMLEKVPEEAKSAIEKAKQKSKKGHLTSVEMVAGEKPEKAVQINAEAIRERLKKAKQEAKKKREEKLKKVLADYEEFKDFQEEMTEKYKTLGTLIAEKNVEEIDDLDEIEDEAEEISLEMKEKIKEIKSEFQENIKESLKGVTEENPEKAAKINLNISDKKLTEIKQKGEKLQEREKNCQTKCSEICKQEEIEPCISECVETAECLDEDEECQKEVQNRCKGACHSKIVLGECVNECTRVCTQRQQQEMERRVNEFENQHRFGEEISAIAQGLGKDTTTIEELVEQANSIHLVILGRVYEKVPEEGKESIERAMEASAKGYQEAVQRLKQKGIQKEEKEIPFPAGVPEETRERVKNRVYQRIREEQRNKERDCINSGGKVTERMCCKAVDDFPNLCLEGPCGCAPEHSYSVKVCDCGEGMCFNGTECVSFGQTNGKGEKQGEQKREQKQVCIQVITPAYNPETGECKEFPTPCDVPEDWEKGCPQEDTPVMERKRGAPNQ